MPGRATAPDRCTASRGWGKIKGGQIQGEIAPKQIWLKRCSRVPVLQFPLSLETGAVSSVLPRLVSGVELWGSASTGQWEGDETRAGAWGSLGSPGAGLTAWLCSAESTEGDVSYRIRGHQHGEPDHPALAR